MSEPGSFPFGLPFPPFAPFGGAQSSNPLGGGTLDPLGAAFRFGQEAYKAGLLALINGRRLQQGASPVAWPTVGGSITEEHWRRGRARLLRYRGLGASASQRDASASSKDAGASRRDSRPAYLMVCSLINRPYVLDLLPERSVVQRLLAAGLDVWLLDWGDAAPEDVARGIADYALETLPAAADAIRRVTGRDAVHVLGYCMGGTFALAAIAAGRLAAASLTALATPIDFHDRGLLSTWCRSPGFDGAALTKALGNVPPHVLQPAFKMLDPVSIATKLVHLDGKIRDDEFLRFFLAMETWLEDSVSFPGAAFREWTAMYRDNSLARATLSLGGVAIDLGRVRCPILNIVAEGDYITPPESSLALERLAPGASHETIRMAGGHIGLSTGRSAHETLWPRVAAWVRARDADAGVRDDGSPARRTRIKKGAAERSERAPAPAKRAKQPKQPKQERRPKRAGPRPGSRR